MAEKLDLQQYKEPFLQHLEEKYSKSTLSSYKYPVREFITYMDNRDETLYLDRDEETIMDNAEIIREYYREVNVHNVKIAAIRKFLDFIGSKVTVKQQITLERTADHITSDKINLDTDSRLSKKELERMLLDEEEIKKMMEEGDTFQELVIRLLLDTGCRAGELAAFKPEDIIHDTDKAAALIEIDKTFVPSEQEIQDHPKTENSYRFVQLSRKTWYMLNDYIEINEIEDDENVIGYYKKVYTAVKDAAADAGVRTYEDPDGETKSFVSPHWFRHVFCTRLVVEDNSFEDDNDVIQATGHQNSDSLEPYKHFDKSDITAIHQ